MTEQQILNACKDSITAWQNAFNNQDAAGCAAQYSKHAVMHARPFGTFKGTTEIEFFWQGIIKQGFKDVEYTDVAWSKFDDKSFILSSKWTMNKAYGVVHRELWRVEEDGKARLIDDEFEVQGER
ncbi:nuclear transport factor 2 family protein [Pseudoalteromonas sp. MMG024]|uniref:nuclear transport factor 2 family protein n=1 Tax=Pseudoalteromonas sp. MMG024 TaxID=2909980 RepID=UPI001F1DE212|nr:nuclear transport factor 2 family protein [Pseudoalteromonas sp. MMG024]MCF6459115.1 nuclear transport factor 2 family protein [Pseudoalteromonas sp. MMG024]